MATVGHTSIFATPSNAGGANLALANQAVAPGSGAITKISLYLDNAGGGSSQNIYASIWVDSGGSPGALIDTSAITAIGAGAAAAWVDFTTISGGSVVSGTTYWIGYTTTGSTTINVYGQAGAANASKYRVGGGVVPQNPFGTPGGSVATDYSMYATFTVAATNYQPGTRFGFL